MVRTRTVRIWSGMFTAFSVENQGADLLWYHAMRVKVIIHENEGGGYTAEVPAIPGCVTEGDTRNALLANLREAVEGCLLTVPGDFAPVDDGGEEQEVEL